MNVREVLAGEMAEREGVPAPRCWVTGSTQENLGPLELRQFVDAEIGSLVLR